ncbi:MAG: hypothetical protein GX660_03715 [Clostridiaceae bacterium]|nr:hypothetical protein [Clostridiaceae bacterium]
MKTKTNVEDITQDQKNQNDLFKNYAITFTTKDKYNPVTRTVTVRTVNEYNAIDIVHRQFGSFKHDKKLMIPVPTDKIKIDKVREVDEFKKDR